MGGWERNDAVDRWQPGAAHMHTCLPGLLAQEPSRREGCGGVDSYLRSGGFCRGPRHTTPEDALQSKTLHGGAHQRPVLGRESPAQACGWRGVQAFGL